MKTEYKSKIQTNFTKLLKKCKIYPDILDIFLQYGVFDKEIIIHINKFKGLDKSRYFFIELTKHGDDAFLAFIRALKILKQDEVIHLLDLNHELQYIEQYTSSRPFALPKETNICYEDEDALKVKVIISEEIYPTKCDMLAYSATSKNRGYVLIINVNNVIAETERIGSHVDVKNLTDMFMQMGFNVLPVETNPTKEIIEKQITKFVSDERLSDADVVFTFVMSHGSSDLKGEFVFGSDRKRVYTSWIENQFSNDVFRHMQQRPKILIFQTCRGDNEDRGIYKIATDGKPKDKKLAAQSDILIVNSTLRGFVSHRDLALGTWYIYCFCKIFMTGAKDTDVETLLKLVNQYLSTQRTVHDDRQTSEFTNRHFKSLYLNPGIYLEAGVIKRFNSNMQ